MSSCFLSRWLGERARCDEIAWQPPFQSACPSKLLHRISTDRLLAVVSFAFHTAKATSLSVVYTFQELNVYATFEASALALESSETEESQDSLVLLQLLSTLHHEAVPLGLFEDAGEGAMIAQKNEDGDDSD